MATDAEVEELRLLVAEPEDELPYTNAALKKVIDASETLIHAAVAVWRQKAAAAAELVDTVEGGSSRKMSDLHKNALAMAGHFTQLIPGADPAAGVGVTRLRRLSR